MSLRTADFDYHLPSELIAQEPAQRREDSRLLVLDRSSGAITHDSFTHIGRHLRASDVLAANRSRVIPARLHATKPTGGTVELLLLRPHGDNRWSALARPSRKLRPDMCLKITGSRLVGILEARCGDGEWTVRFSGQGDIGSQLQVAGTIPLPPYIHNRTVSRDRYQTVYADRDGSVAAPTAGLHFSQALIERLHEGGIDVHYVTLHIGLGTFKPVSADLVEDHRLHAEWGEVPREVASALNIARRRGGRLVAVGTTATRLLETAWNGTEIQPFSGDTDRFIYPGYRFGAIDALITNFHLPRSSLLMLVSAFAGREHVLNAYAEAVRRRYRFYSFGDAMLIV